MLCHPFPAAPAEWGTMLAEQLANAIGTAPLRALDDLTRDVWRAMGSGLLSEDAAQALAETAQARRVAARHLGTSEGKRPPLGSLRAWSYFPPKRPQRSPDRARSIARRRTLAAASPMPPALACRFTTGELAVLAVIGAEVAQHGACSRSVPEIAARAGVSASTVRNAIRAARRLGVISVEERRQHCAPNLPNLIRITSPEWGAWIARRPRDGGCKTVKATEIRSSIGKTRERESDGMASVRWSLAAQSGNGRSGTRSSWNACPEAS